jgi:hypothetical protein
VTGSCECSIETSGSIKYGWTLKRSTFAARMWENQIPSSQPSIGFASVTSFIVSVSIYFTFHKSITRSKTTWI